MAAESNEDEFVRSIFAKAQNKIDNPLYLSKVIAMINEVTWFDLSADVKGDLYESILQKNG